MNVDSSQRSVNMLLRRLLLFAAGLRPILNYAIFSVQLNSG